MNALYTGVKSMIVVSFPLDSSLAQAKAQGNIRSVKKPYELLTCFDDVALLTQDTQEFVEESSGILHVPLGNPRFESLRGAFSELKYLRWFAFSISSLAWFVKRRERVALVLGVNVDSPAPLIFSTLCRVPYVIHYNYDVAMQVREVNRHRFQGTLVSILEQLCFKRASSVWVTAKSLVAKAQSLGARRIRLVPNYLDLNETSIAKIKKDPADVGREVKILFVGRLHVVKRVDLLLQAFSVLRKFFPDARLCIVGDGEERGRLESMAERLHLGGNVVFTGFVDQEKVFEMMKQADVLVLPSRVEGNPRVLIEAMFLRVPIVATDVPGIHDIVENGKTGYLVSHASPTELAQMIKSVLESKQDVLGVVENAHSFAERNFSKECVLQTIREELASLVPSFNGNLSDYYVDRACMQGGSSASVQTVSSLSIVVPAHNCEVTIGKCLTSILRAAPKGSEIIVVDDGSTDGTRRVVSSFPTKLIGLPERRGASVARNIGVARASGKIVAFVDGDCEVEENCFRELSSILSKSPNIGCVGGLCCPLEKGLVSQSFSVRFFACFPFDERKVRKIGALGGSAVAYPRKVFDEVGGFDPKLRGGEDFDLNVRIRRAGYELLLVPSARYFHPHPNSLGSLVRKWFRYGQFMANVSVKNKDRKELPLTWGWFLTCVFLFSVGMWTSNLPVWLLLLFVFWLPWLLFYSRATVKFLRVTRQLRFLVFPFIHQVVIISRSAGAVSATPRSLWLSLRGFETKGS